MEGDGIVNPITIMEPAICEKEYGKLVSLCFKVFKDGGSVRFQFHDEYPTKALAPLMLEDYRKVMVERRGEEEQFSYEHIIECMKKVIALDLKQTVNVDKDLQIRAYYAGHVLGAAMIYAKVGHDTMVYTGDYNMTPDRHLGAAQIERLQLDLLITESTYATTIRDSKYARETEFLKVVHKCISRGGKVLIPTFALGRAQELCLLLDDYWERMNLKVPIYFSAGLTIQANMYYKMLISWTSQKIKDTYATRNAFDFKHVCPFERSFINAPGPCVLFATPGMISGGFSLEVFKQWAPSEINLVTLPGYCVAGTIGHKLMSGKPTRIDLDKDTHIDVRCQIHQLSFSPHTDAKGIMDLVGLLSPQHVILVHGEKPKMALLKGRIQTELGIQCYDPANNETVFIPTNRTVKTDATKAFIKSCSIADFHISSNPLVGLTDSNCEAIELFRAVEDKKEAEGILVMDKTKRAKIVCENELMLKLGVEEHGVKFAYCCPVYIDFHEQTSHQLASGSCVALENENSSLEAARSPKCSSLQILHRRLESQICCKNLKGNPDYLKLNSITIHSCSRNFLSLPNQGGKTEADQCNISVVAGHQLIKIWLGS
ncbi:hypothetical protein J5N97_009301 [Dioscorea zingiberensis]|uniref:Beta-Casp domain-containing protein n=1 Tax=Dioscorea zingiberensis TaxID=325984 RepID=A0A9D5HLU8_9LILI|nr:hypothetical protein J5N97_009301 [Dioscorea zingiberensis]